MRALLVSTLELEGLGTKDLPGPKHPCIDGPCNPSSRRSGQWSGYFGGLGLVSQGTVDSEKLDHGCRMIRACFGAYKRVLFQLVRLPLQVSQKDMNPKYGLPIA